MATFSFGPKANQSVFSQRSHAIVSQILDAAGLATCKITSTSRTPADQARAMFNNIVNTSVKKQKNLYGANGDKVIDVFVAQKAAGKSATEIKAAMTAKIIELGPGRVSHHCADPAVLNVIDIAPSSIAKKQAFEDAVEDAMNAGLVSRFIRPPVDPAYHLEIPQT
jgi:hypothetical protein